MLHGCTLLLPRDGPSQLLSQADDNVWELDPGLPVAEALQLLVQLVPGAASIRPGVNCAGRFAPEGRPAVPTGDHSPMHDMMRGSLAISGCLWGLRVR